MDGQTKAVIRPATLADVRPYFGGLPPFRLRAYVGTYGDSKLGLGGLYFLPDGTRVGFLVLEEEGYKHPRVLYRAAFEFLKMLKDEGAVPIRAVADPAIPNAGNFLKNLGFGVLEVYERQTLYQWPAPNEE